MWGYRVFGEGGKKNDLKYRRVVYQRKYLPGRGTSYCQQDNGRTRQGKGKI